MADRRKQPDTYGIRQHFHGKMVRPPGKRVDGKGRTKMGKGHGGPRANTHGGRSQADNGYECGQDKAIYPKGLPAKYKRSMPNGRTSYIDQPGWRHRGEYSRIARPNGTSE